MSRRRASYAARFPCSTSRQGNGAARRDPGLGAIAPALGRRGLPGGPARGLRRQCRQNRRTGAHDAQRDCGARREDLQRRDAVGLRTDVLRDLPRTRARARHRQSRRRRARRRARCSTTPGFRNAPSLRYLDLTPAFFFAQGRHADRRLQPRRPRAIAGRAGASAHSSPPHEMANGTADAGDRAAASRRPTPRNSAACSAPASSTTPTPRSTGMRFALAQYPERGRRGSIRSTASTTCSSRDERQLTARELQGLALFNNPEKGNCAACHPERARRRRLAAAVHRLHLRQHRRAAQPRHSRQRRSARTSTSACADPSAPTSPAHRPVRRVQGADAAQRRGHARPISTTGASRRCKDVVGFYVRRDTNPEEWYPRNADGSVRQVRRPAAAVPAATST